MKVVLNKICRRFFFVCVALFAITLAINLFIICTTRNCIFTHLKDLPSRQFELVLGTEPVRPDGSVNLHFSNRTDAAARVYLAGKSKEILISGNKNNRGFNEVLEMKNRILAKNVPASALVLDFDGTKTFDSIRHAREVYHLGKLIVITSVLHAPRALYFCRHFEIDAVAYCPDKDPFGVWSVRYQVREYFARLKAVWDVLTDWNHE
jgi:SanA protein